MQIETPLGNLKFSYTAEGKQYEKTDGDFSLLFESYVPQLPSGMSVQNCVAVLLYINSSKDINGISLKCEWVTEKELEFGPETGEGLEAQVWEDGDHIVMIGTEDVEWASASFPKGVIFPKNLIFTEYSSSGLVQNIESVFTKTRFYLHFIIAWNSLPEPEDCSCWTAVHKDASAMKRIIKNNFSG